MKILSQKNFVYTHQSTWYVKHTVLLGIKVVSHYWAVKSIPKGILAICYRYYQMLRSTEMAWNAQVWSGSWGHILDSDYMYKLLHFILQCHQIFCDSYAIFPTSREMRATRLMNISALSRIGFQRLLRNVWRLLVRSLLQRYNRVFWRYTNSVSFRRMDKGGQNNTLRKIGVAKGLCVAAHPVRGSGGMPPQKIFEI